MHRSRLTCRGCAPLAAMRLGASGWGRTGPLLTEDGTVKVHGPTEKVALPVHDADGRLLDVLDLEEPNPEAGQSVTFTRGYAHHDGYGERTPAHRREGLPDGFLLAGLERQLLPVLDHWAALPPVEGELVKHLRAVGAVGPEWGWLRSVAELAEPFTLEHGERRYRRPWKDVRRAAARYIAAKILGEDAGTVRRRIQNHERNRNRPKASDA